MNWHGKHKYNVEHPCPVDVNSYPIFDDSTEFVNSVIFAIISNLYFECNFSWNIKIVDVIGFLWQTFLSDIFDVEIH